MDASSHEAAALKLQQDGGEIAAMIAENIHAEAQRTGRAVEPADLGQAIGPFLSAAWLAAKLAFGDRQPARGHFVRLLREWADDIERSD